MVIMKRGGAIFAENSTITVKNCTFVNNKAQYGGAFCIDSANNIIIKDCTFINNEANDGGAIYTYNSDVLIDNSLFLNNSAYTGAAILFGSYKNIIISNSIFNSNLAQKFFGIDDSGGSEYKYGDVYLTSRDGLADHQMAVDAAYFPNLTFINISYNEFKNQSFEVKVKDINRNINNETIRFELFKDDNLLINTTNVTKNGIAKIDYGNLSVGDYYLKVFYKNLTDSDTIRVAKDVNLSLSVEDIFIGEDLIVNFNISCDIEGYFDDFGGDLQIWYDISSENYRTWPVYDEGVSFKDKNITIPFLSSDTYLISLGFYGDENYSSKVITQTFNVYLADYNMTGNKTILKIEDFEKTFSEDERLYINLTDKNNNPLKNKEIFIKINGITYNRTTNNDGQASIAIKLNSGEYPVVISFRGDDQYLPITDIVSIRIPSTIDCKDYMWKYYKDSNKFWARFFDFSENCLEGGKATFKINGVCYTRDIDKDGFAKLNINLPQGEYILTAINPVTGHMKSCLIKVLPTIVDNHDLVKYYRNDSQYVVKLQGEDSKNEKVTFNINGVIYERVSDEFGFVKLNINFQPGEYVITAEFKGCKVSNNITVLPVLYASDLEMYYKDGSTFNVTLVEGKGFLYPNQIVTFNINGVIYERITGEDDIARLNINLQKGEYIITSSYNGANIANKITILG